MTCIVMVKKPDTVFAAFDSECSTDHSRTRDKIAKVIDRDGILIGVAGPAVICLAMQRAKFKPRNGECWMDWLCDSVVPAFQSALTSVRLQETNNLFGEEDQIPFEILMAVESEIIVVSADFTPMMVDEGKAAIGGGGDIAMGCLWTLENVPNILTVEDAAVLAVEAACSLSVGCGGPVRTCESRAFSSESVVAVTKPAKRRTRKV